MPFQLHAEYGFAGLKSSWAHQGEIDEGLTQQAIQASVGQDDAPSIFTRALQDVWCHA